MLYFSNKYIKFETSLFIIANCRTLDKYYIYRTLRLKARFHCERGMEQWRTQKVSEGGDKVSSQSCDVTNQLGESRRHDQYRVVRGHAQKIFAKLHLRIGIFVHSGSKF